MKQSIFWKKIKTSEAIDRQPADVLEHRSLKEGKYYECGSAMCSKVLYTGLAGAFSLSQRSKLEEFGFKASLSYTGNSCLQNGTNEAYSVFGLKDLALQTVLTALLSDGSHLEICKTGVKCEIGGCTFP